MDALRNHSTITLYSEENNNLLREAARQAGIMSSDYGNAFYKISRMASESGSSFLSATWDFSKLSESEYNQLLKKLAELSSKYEDSVQIAKGDIAAANSDIVNYINTWLSSDWNFNKMDSNLQNVVKDVLFNMDWINTLPSDVNSNDWDKVSNWLQRKFLYAINDINNAEIENTIVDAFNGVFTTDSLQTIIDQLTSDEYGFTADNPLILYLQTKLTKRIELVDDVKDKLQDKFDNKVEQLNIEDLQIAANLEVPEGTLLSWDELIAKIKEAKKLSADEVTVLSVSETIDQLDTQLKPAFDSLQSAYQDIIIDNDFVPENVNFDTLQKIKKEIDALNEIEEISIDASTFEDFARVLTDTSSTAEDVRNQFNSLASTIAYATGGLDVNSDTFNVLAKSLEGMGIANARDVLNEIIELQKEFQAVSEELGLTLEEVSNATYEEAVQMLIEAQAAGKDTQVLFQLAAAKGIITDGTISTESNIDALIAEAKAAGLDAAMISHLENVRDGNIKDTNSVQTILNNARQKLSEAVSGYQLDFNLPKNAGQSSSSKSAEQEIDVMSELSSQMDKLQSAYKSLCEIRDTYNESGKITMDQYQELTDMGFGFLANLIDENGQLGVNAQAFEKLSNAKLQEMQIQLARNAIDTINGIKSETEAVEYLTYANENLRDASLSATEALLREAQAAAHTRGEQQALAADQIVQGYEASKALVGKIEFGELPEAARDAQDSAKETYNWIENLLDTLSKKTSALIDVYMNNIIYSPWRRTINTTTL